MRSFPVDPRVAVMVLVIASALGGVSFRKGREVKGLMAEVASLERELALTRPPVPVQNPKVNWVAVTIPSLLDDLARMGSQKSVEMTLVQPGEAAQKEGYIEQPVHLELEGKYRDIGEYLSLVERLQKTIRITGLKLEKSSSGPPLISAVLDLMVYRRGAP